MEIVHVLGRRLRQVIVRLPLLFAIARPINARRRRVVRWLRWWRLPRRERARATVTLSTLANHGFGNQLFQYMFIKTYALRHGLRLEIPPWMGEHVYGLREPRVTRSLPEFRERFEHGVDDTLLPHAETSVRNVDFRGYFQYHTSYYAPFKADIQDWFQPTGLFAQRAEEAWSALSARGHTIVGLHLRHGLRRGDWGSGYFFITPSSWCLDWLEEIWPTLKDPVLFLATDAPKAVKSDFAAFAPVMASDLGVSEPRFDFFLDFHLLTQCDRLAIANSTFSFTASMLNQRATEFVRPDLAARRLVPYDPWFSKPMLQDQTVENHPNIPGIAWADSPS